MSVQSPAGLMRRLVPGIRVCVVQCSLQRMDHTSTVFSRRGLR
jgi:hypothetical protein